MQDKLKRRKLDALKRGVHRATGADALSVATHIVGIGAAGISVIAEALRTAEPGAPKLRALAIDVAGDDLASLRALLGTLPQNSADVAIVSVPTLTEQDLDAAIDAYPRHLTLEYPRMMATAPIRWLPRAAPSPGSGGSVARSVAKALYGVAYYAGARPMERALREFADAVETSVAQPVIAIVFGLGGGTGSGIAVDLARHLSTRMLGRRALVTAVAIAPCSGDVASRRGGRVFATINELDCFGDETKTEGVVAGCGELFRNPFTAGCVLVPQQHVWEETRSLPATHARVDREITCLLTGRGGMNLWETLRMLNWVAAPSTQHSAARTPWGGKWIHMLGFADIDGPLRIDETLPERLGILPDYKPEYLEARIAEGSDPGDLSERLERAFAPDVPPQIVAGGNARSVQFILPCLAKSDLAVFYDARDDYDARDLDERQREHALLLERGLILSERSTRLPGMAGQSIGGSAGWIAVPFEAVRGDDRVPPVRSARDAA